MKKINKETFRAMCESFDQLAVATTGMTAACFCGHHMTRDYGDETFELFKKSCDHIESLIIEDSESQDKLKKQIEALQEAYKTMVKKLELIIGILAMDENPSSESQAALTLLKKDNLTDFGNASVLKIPHVIFIYYTAEGQIKNVKWIKQTSGAEFPEIDTKKEDL